MRVLPETKRQRAFALTELVVMVLMVALLLVLLVPTLYYGKEKSRRIGCASNLKNLGLGFRILASSHGGQFPVALATNQTESAGRGLPPDLVHYFRAMSNELGTPKLLACPADVRKPALDFPTLGRDNVSYFIGLGAVENVPSSLLHGDRNLTVNGAAISPGVFELTTNMTVGWTKDLHKFRGQFVLGDGSVQQFSQARFNAWLPTSGVATNRLVIP